MHKPYNRAEVSFQLHTEIGQEGANSTVWIAHDDQLDAEIVIKKISKTSLDVNTYFQESRILYLSTHPNVVPVYYACQDADSIYIAMPYYPNGSLNGLMNSRFLTVREIIVLGCQIASGLHNVHSKKLIHFDIKPDNVLLSERGEALISDFGLSQRISLSGTASQERFYMKMVPPEAYSSSEHTPTFDVYQFGLTLYRMCNGNESFNSQFDRYVTGITFDRENFKVAVCSGQFPDKAVFEAHIPERLRKLIKKCLQPDPNERFQTVILVANELAQIEDSLDWKFSKIGADRIWIRSDPDKEYRIVVKPNGESQAEKTIFESGRIMRIAKYCKVGITSREIRTFLGET